MSEKTYANIMMIGRTGVGKSSFLNYLLNIEDIPTGKGEPVTQGFNKYEFENLNGLPIRLFDSKGLEVSELSSIKSDIISYIKTSCGNSDPTKWLHSIFYCVNVKRARLEDEEASFVKEICNTISQTVHIIITHCDAPDADNVIEMEKHIRSVLPNKNIKIIKVNSVETKKRNGTHVKPFGKEEALDTIFSVLWSDIATRISNEYASELYDSIKKQASIIRRTLNSVVDKVTTITVLKEITNEGGFDSTLNSANDKFDREIEKEKEKLSQKYTNIISPLVEFYNNYSEGLGYRISIFEYDDFIPEECMDRICDIDTDDIMEHSQMGRIMKEVENIDGSNIFGMLKTAGKMIGMLLKIQSLLREVVDEIARQYEKALPSKNEISNEMYAKLMEQIQ